MNRTIMQVVVAAICFALFGVAYFRLLDVYRAEGVKVVRKFSEANAQKETFVDVKASLVSIDPVKGDLVLRLTFDYTGAMLDEQGMLAKPTTVFTNSTAGKADTAYKKGESIQPQDVTLALQGEYTQYPWDAYSAPFTLSVVQQQEVNGRVEWVDIPVALEIKTGLAGFNIVLADKGKKFPWNTRIDFDVSRARSATGFAVFIMGLIGGLTLMAFLVGLAVVVGGRRAEPPMLGWFGALLFAMVPLRNAMPGAPPIGVLADYMSFFWAEAVIAVVLVAVVMSWIIRSKPA